MCIQRIRRGTRKAKRESKEVMDGDISPACVQACPTDAMVFGNQKDPESTINKMKNDKRAYTLLDHLGTSSNVWYLAKIDEDLNSHQEEDRH
jgi:molybdopterin-containing oxidoreductase family iron-sulfur binding subunit